MQTDKAFLLNVRRSTMFGIDFQLIDCQSALIAQKLSLIFNQVFFWLRTSARCVCRVMHSSHSKSDALLAQSAPSRNCREQLRGDHRLRMPRPTGCWAEVNRSAVSCCGWRAQRCALRYSRRVHNWLCRNHRQCVKHNQPASRARLRAPAPQSEDSRQLYERQHDSPDISPGKIPVHTLVDLLSPRNRARWAVNAL